MAHQCREVYSGESGDAIPADMINIFKEGTAARLRRDKFTYVQSITKEIAMNIERVRVRQGQFVAFLGSIVLSIFMFVSNLASLAVDRYLNAEDGLYGDGSQ